MSTEAIKELFFAALQQRTEDRAQFLLTHCGDEPELQHRVLTLLNAHDRAAGFLEDIPSETKGQVATSSTSSDTQVLEESAGPYRLMRKLGEGGFGVVYLAQQDEPIRRQVAVKILKSGMDSHQLTSRFAAERQALAVMQHPGIAQVFDAGTTTFGRPYLVMEYVDGAPIVDDCRQRRLSIPDRLWLFIEVCSAVQHAHHKGLIHRDLKPSNVLVANVDGQPIPKIIDFGIAKVMQGSALPDMALTLERQLIGTPQYMSPEQASPNTTDIDTRTDIYSLGVILYELLTGETPLADAMRSNERAANQAVEMKPWWTYHELTPPSSRIAAMGDDAESFATHCQLDAHRLWRILQRDLDWIVLRALEVDRDRRYPTVDALAADLGRFLAGEPVEAGPPGWAYRARKLAHRYRGTLSVLAVSCAALLALAVGSVWFGYREFQANARTQAALKRAQAQAAFSEQLLSGIDPAEARQSDTTLLRKILAAAPQRVLDELSDQPAAAAQMLNTIGYASLRIGDFLQAEETLNLARSYLQQTPNAASELEWDIWLNQVVTLIELQKFPEAEESATDLIRAARKSLGSDHPQTLTMMGNYAELLNRTGRWTEARDVWQEIYEARRQSLGDDDPATIAAQQNLAVLQSNLGDNRASADTLNQIMQWQAMHLGEDHPQTLMTMNNLSDVWFALGEIDASLALAERALAMKQAVLGIEHPSYIVSQNNLANLYLKLERWQDAAQLIDDALPVASNALGDTDMRTLALRNTHAKRLKAEGRVADAVDVLEQLHPAFRSQLGEDHPHTLTILDHLAAGYADLGRWEPAEQAARSCYRLAGGRYGEIHPQTIQSACTLGNILAQTDRVDEAVKQLGDLLAQAQATHGDTHPVVVRLGERLAEIQAASSMP